MIAAVVFDLDGVIVDSEIVWERVRRRYVDERGGRWPDDAQKRLMGMSTPEWARYLATEFAIEGLDPAVVADDVVSAMAREYEAHLPLIPGAAEAAHAVAGRWPVAVASSSPPRLIEVVLATIGLDVPWVSSEQVPRGKPAPDVYLAAVARLGLAPSECAAVEDSSNGLRSAHAAGTRVVAVPRAEYPPDPDALALAALTVHDIRDLTPALLTTL
jgi:beta-phosphoglucomutase-like phosphatase (HAD superfamily)